MAEYLIQEETLTAIADAIRTKTGGTEELSPDQMATEISEIETGGEDVTAETDAYTDLLTELETAIDALPEAGSGSGGSVETCTVNIIYSVTRSFLYMWSLIGYDAETGKIVLLQNEISGGTTNITYDNVVCGTDIALYCEGMSLPTSFECSGGVEKVDAGHIIGVSGMAIWLKAPTEAESIGSCIIS